MAFRSFCPFGRQSSPPYTTTGGFYPFPIVGDPDLGDGTEYIMECDATVAMDHNWGWNKPLEHATFSIDSFTIGSGGTFTDSQVPITLVYVNDDFGAPYTPDAPGPDFSAGGPEAPYSVQTGGGYNDAFGAGLGDLVDGRIYLGTLPDAVYDEDISDYVDALLYGRIDRVYNILPVQYQDPNARKFFSKSWVTYTLRCWLEADIADVISQLITGISFSDGSDYVYPLNSAPDSFLDLGGVFSSIATEGASELDDIILPDELRIKLYEISNQESGGGAIIAWSFVEAELEVQRWGARTPL